MVTRIGGIVSGLDVDTLVKQMISVKRIPLDKLNQQKQILQWQRDNYREINSKLVDFRNSKLQVYDTSAQMNTKTVVVSGNTPALKAEATADANGIPMKIEIISLAEPVTWETTGMSMMAADGTTRLTSKTKLSELQALNGGASLNGSYNIKVNGVNMDFDKDLSIAEVVSKINSNTAANVTATFDEVSGNFSIASKIYGSKGKVEISTGTNSLLEVFGSSGAPYNPLPFKSAEIKVNDNVSTLKFDSNNFLLNGVNLTLIAKTETNPVTVTTQSDSTKSLETITNFVKDYNDLLSSLQSKVAEERYKDFTPLTDEQKKEMTEKDIEMWETKSKSGLLKNDEILKSTISSMRSELSKRLGDLSSIGITTGQYFENGKLYIDQDKLKQVLADSPLTVTNIFQGVSGSNGLFDKLTSNIDMALDKIVTKAGTSKYSTDLTIAFKSDSFMGKRLTDYNTRINSFQTRLTNMEANYYKQFTAMETAMNKYNSQSSSLSSYFA